MWCAIAFWRITFSFRNTCASLVADGCYAENRDNTMITAKIAAIVYHLPEKRLRNEELAVMFPEWTADTIKQKLGICERRVAAPNECASDLAVEAAEKLFLQSALRREEVDYLLLCTQSPDFILPTTACLLQERLGLSTYIGALDFNLGCSGYIYGLGLARGLIETGQAQNVLLITAETYSKHIHAEDKNVLPLFGDAAAATWVRAVESDMALIGPFVYGTDGRGAKQLIVSGRGMRNSDSSGADPWLRMEGQAIFAFALQTVPEAVSALLQKAGYSIGEIDLCVLHQANKYMLDCLRKKLGVPTERFVIALENYGNTVSSTIPIALTDVHAAGGLEPGRNIMMVGFGVGLSWAGCLARFP
jgi:3-oxoacyl-[acyl-carrier-protein] synthase III